MIGLCSRLLFIPSVAAFALLSMIPYHYLTADGSLTSLTNQSGDSNNTNSSAPSLSNILIDNNQTLPLPSNFTAGFHGNSTIDSTNSSLSVKNSNATNQDQKQDLMSSYIRQHQPSSGADMQSQQNQQIPQPYLPPPQQQQQQPLSQFQAQPQSPPQSYTYTPPTIQQPQQQQPFAQPYPPPASPSYTIPYNPPLAQPTEVPPRILSDNNYVASTGSLHIVGEVINESYQPASYVRITATFYDTNNSVI